MDPKGISVVDRESAYFHVGNGGLALFLQEKYTAGYGSTYQVRYEMSNLGAQAAGEFDLPPVAAQWMQAALTKLWPEIVSSEVGRTYTPYDGTTTLYTNGREIPSDANVGVGKEVMAKTADTSSRALDHFLWKYRVQVPGTNLEETLDPETGVSKAGQLAYKMAAIACMVKEAISFPTPKALREYLKQHPKADPSKHEVEKPKDKAEKSKETPKKDPKKDEAEETPDFSTLGKKLADKVKGWGAKAVKALTDAPKEAKKFVEDDAHRRKTLMEAHKKMEHLFNLPTALIDTAKGEVHEFKAAGGALKKLAKGDTLDKHDKHALKTVGTHLAITAAATAFTATSLGAGAAIFGKALAKHVALKAVSASLAKGHMLEELGHVGHGIQHLMDKFAAKEKEQKSADPMVTFTKMVLAAVAKEMEGLDVATIGEALNTFSEGDDVRPLPTSSKKAMQDRLVERFAAIQPEKLVADAVVEAYKKAGHPLPNKNGEKQLQNWAAGVAKRFTALTRDYVYQRSYTAESKYAEKAPLRVLREESEDFPWQDDNEVWWHLELDYPEVLEFQIKIEVSLAKLTQMVADEVSIGDLDESGVWALLKDPQVEKAFTKAFAEIAGTTALGDQSSDMESAVIDFALDKCHRSVDSDDEDAAVPYGKHTLEVWHTERKIRPVSDMVFELRTTFTLRAEAFWPGDRRYEEFM